MLSHFIFIALIAGGILGVLAFVNLMSEQFERQFMEEWPAIDDDEFVRRCPTGTSREIALKVRRIVADQLDLPYHHVYPEQNLVEDLGAD